MKKIYSKPEAELVSFYSEEEITADISGILSEMGVTDMEEGWGWT